MQDITLSHTAEPSFSKPYAFGVPYYCVTYHTLSPVAIYFEGFQQFGCNVVWTSQPYPASSV